MRFGSLFSGVGGFDLGLERAGHEVVFQAESDPYRRRVLARHWPDVPCYEDVRDVASDVGSGRPRVRSQHSEDQLRAGLERPRSPEWSPASDLLCGGFPCQDLSVAGRRAGLAGERSSLFFEFARIADALLGDGGWLLIENVPGLLSSHGGRDFAVLLATLAELGFHDLAWRVLDSRHFGVPQRRRRVFILARRASGGRAAAVLLERESGGGHPAPRGEAREGVAGSVADGARSPSFAPALMAKAQRNHPDEEHFVVAHTLRAEGFDASEDGTGRGTPLVVPDAEGLPTAAHSGCDRPAQRRGGGNGDGAPAHANGVRAPSGLPGRLDDPKPDGPRYAAMGDAVTVNVLEWIGRRLMNERKESH